jgi:hypothetical protein
MGVCQIKTNYQFLPENCLRSKNDVKEISYQEFQEQYDLKNKPKGVKLVFKYTAKGGIFDSPKAGEIQNLNEVGSPCKPQFISIESFARRTNLHHNSVRIIKSRAKNYLINNTVVQKEKPIFMSNFFNKELFQSGEAIKELDD